MLRLRKKKMKVVATIVFTLYIFGTKGDSVCNKRHQWSVAHAFQKISPLAEVIFYDLTYDDATNMGGSPRHYFLGDVKDPNERWHTLNGVLDQTRDKNKFIIVMGDGQVQGKFESNKHHWLLEDSNELDNMTDLRLDSLVFLYNCSEDCIHINELYAVKGHVVNNFVGRIPKAKDVISYQTSSNIWQRRKDLFGTTIINTYLPYPTLNMPILNQDGETIGHTGYMVEMLENLGTTLNCTIKWTQPPTRSWGKKIANTTSYDGILGQLINGTADVSSAGLFVNSDRMEILDFTVFTYKFVITITTCHTNNVQEVNLEAFVALFSNKVWISYIALICFFVSVWSGSNFVQSNGSFRYSSALATVGIMSMPSSVHIVPAHSSTKLLLILTSSFAFLIYVHYTANLTTLMTAGPPPLNLKSFQDILDKDINVIIWKGGTPNKAMADAKEGTAQHEVYMNMLGIPEKSFFTSQDDITNKLTSNPKSAYYGPFYAFVKDPKFKIFMVDEMVGTHAGFALGKDSEFRELFDYFLAMLRETGNENLLKLKHTTSRKEINFEVHFNLNIFIVYEISEILMFSQQEPLSLGYENLFLPSIILAFGVTLALVLSLTEYSSNFKHRRTAKNLHLMNGPI